MIGGVGYEHSNVNDINSCADSTTYSTEDVLPDIDQVNEDVLNINQIESENATRLYEIVTIHRLMYPTWCSHH